MNAEQNRPALRAIGLAPQESLGHNWWRTRFSIGLQPRQDLSGFEPPSPPARLDVSGLVISFVWLGDDRARLDLLSRADPIRGDYLAFASLYLQELNYVCGDTSITVDGVTNHPILNLSTRGSGEAEPNSGADV